ncbi:hypothetical protein GY45DRAFT_985792 [Cubamyces sp. BRFM 1775]|nr:hypothetical protein GY45DRAFT_985792 [Cubamyces sp. BRFM 1775]
MHHDGWISSPSPTPSPLSTSLLSIMFWRCEGPAGKSPHAPPKLDSSVTRRSRRSSVMHHTLQSVSLSLPLTLNMRTYVSYIHTCSLIQVSRTRCRRRCWCGPARARRWSALVLSLLYRTGPWLYYYIARLTNISSAFFNCRMVSVLSSSQELLWP